MIEWIIVNIWAVWLKQIECVDVWMNVQTNVWINEWMNTWIYPIFQASSLEEKDRWISKVRNVLMSQFDQAKAEQAFKKQGISLLIIKNRG